MWSRSDVRRFVFLVSVLLFIFPGSPKSSPAAVVESGDGAVDVGSIARTASEKFPDSDAVIVYDSLIVTLNEDGLISRRRHREVVLFTDDAIRRYGDPRILYDSENQVLEIRTARVYMRDGTAVDTRENGKNQTTPSALASAPDYTSWQEMVVTHVGIEKGCIAELEYTISDRKANSVLLSGCFIFNEDDPALERTLVLRVMKSKKLKAAGFNGAPSGEVSDDGTTYTWRMTDLGCRKTGKGYAWDGDYLPCVCYSTAPGWDVVAAVVAARFGEAAGECSFSEELIGPEAAGMDNMALIRYIQRKVIEALREVKTPYEILDRVPRAADRVYESGYADPFDMAVVLGALLIDEGFRPYPVLVTKGRFMPSAIPVMDIFEKILLAVPLDDSLVLLDPGEEYTRDPALLNYGRELFHCNIPSRAELAGKGLDSESSGSELTLELSFDGDDLVGEGFIRMNGVYSPYWIVAGRDGELRRYLVDRIGPLFDEAEVVDWNVSELEKDGVEIGFKIRVKSFIPPSKDRIYFTLPLPFDSFLSGIKDVDLSASQAAAPLRVVSSKLRADIKMEVPKGWRFSHLPEDVYMENELGKLNVTVSGGGEGVLRFVSEFSIKKDLVPVRLYPDFRKMVLYFTNSRGVLSRI